MSKKEIRVHGVSPVHPGRGEPSRIEMILILDYLKGSPIAVVEISPRKALIMAEELVRAARIVTDNRAEANE